MKNLLILSSIIIVSTKLYSQSSFEANFTSSTKIGGETNNHIVLINEVVNDINFNAKAAVHSKTSKSTIEFPIFTYIGVKNPNWKTDNEFYKTSFITENAIAVFSYHLNKIDKKVDLEISKFDLEGKPTGIDLRFPSRRYEAEQYQPLDYVCIQSSDKTKLAIISHSFERKLNEMITFRIIDLKTNTLIDDQDILLTSISDRYIFDEFSLSNDGTLYQLKYDPELKKNFVGVLSNKIWKQHEIDVTRRIHANFFDKSDGSIDIVGVEQGWNGSASRMVFINYSDKHSAPIINFIGFDNSMFSEVVKNNEKSFKNDPKYGPTSPFGKYNFLQNPVTKTFVFAFETVDNETISVGTPEKPINNFVFNTKQRMLFEVNNSFQISKVHYDLYNSGQTKLGTFTSSTNEYQGFNYQFTEDGILHIFHNTASSELNSIDQRKTSRYSIFGGNYLLIKESINQSFDKLPATFIEGEPITKDFSSNNVFFMSKNNSTLSVNGKINHLIFAANKVKYIY